MGDNLLTYALNFGATYAGLSSLFRILGFMKGL